MRNVDWKTVLAAGLVAIVVVIVGHVMPEARAGLDTGDGNRDMIAVTGEYGNGTAVLYVIDTKSKQLAVYRAMNGSGVELVGARRIEHDLKLLSYRDRTPEAYAPLALERNYRRYRERVGSSDAAPAPGAAAPADPGGKPPAKPGEGGSGGGDGEEK